MRDYIAPMRQPRADALLQKHRDQGDHLLIITATNHFITGPIAAFLGVGEILATDPEMIDGFYTGRVSGTPCFQRGKVTRLEQWLKSNSHSLDNSFFYSDSFNDLPLLELVDNPVAVDPDDRLAKHAVDHQWPIISLRGST
jgi:HAD superfamily hydrolase (TIGR01490 family)